MLIAPPPPWHSEAIIADTLQRGPEMAVSSSDGRWRFTRWRSFVGNYTLPGLPEPLFVVHLGGKPNVRTWDRDGWSETTSFPGAATIVPATMPTRWLVDGELDVVTFSIDRDDVRAASVLEHFGKMHFAFSDPLGAALARQILAELYKPSSDGRDAYVAALIDALKAHMMRGPSSAGPAEFPTSSFSSYRIHNVLNAIARKPEADHSLDELAELAGLTRSHFCRVFKRAVGLSPHQYLLKARLDRAQQILCQGDMSIAVIAEMLGFTSQSHFNRAFREQFGEPPSTHRKRGVRH
ncbi:AraC family transcriptional regulator [Sphingobium sufflavum]|uniref:helix-turn-helix domain-containing protein n=1 Tax=Sphingobium sufflavum TaxID=1129547 RepID=UPI001F338F4A|nr:AraC family transcriptional regulator [Sphingobium sufflavum]MCE7795418.1 AraC family transcriptional regulator [Sphingobium sufflavum]